MSSMISPQEIRYSAISFVALAIITRVLNFMYADYSKHTIKTPTIPENGSGTKITDPAYWTALDLSTVPDALTDVLGLLPNIFNPILQIFNGWIGFIDMAGWASFFVVLPSLIMFMVTLNVAYKLVKAFPTT